MKALTISQPFASLIASGEKWIENRCWYTSYRGEIAIHAGKGTQYMTRKELDNVPNGCILGSVELRACVPMADVLEHSRHAENHKLFVPGTTRTWLEVAQHAHAEGPFCWILSDLRRLGEPIPCKGAQGLWEWNN